MGVKGVFERLDQSYLDDLVVKSRQGDSNAFAELFASVADRQLFYLTNLFGNREQAVKALEPVFINALKSLPGLVKPELFTIWLCRMATNEYLEESGIEKARNTRYTLSQLLNLPLAESQIMMMSFEQGLTDAEIADILNIGRSTVRRFIKLAARHLPGSPKNADNMPKAARRDKGSTEANWLVHHNALTPIESAEILDAVFEACGRDANTVPMEALSSYAVYRKERFSLQRGILTAALIVFLMLPALFLIPSYEVSVENTGERGLPVYTIDVKSVMPINKVLASLGNHGLPVYEADARKFTVEPTRNGIMSVEVELINRQSVLTKYEVSGVDANGPVLVGSETGDDTFVIRIEDAGIGVDYREIYAVGKSGKVYHPISADPENGVVFEYPDEKWDVYIPDHIGNTLHLSIKLK